MVVNAYFSFLLKRYADSLVITWSQTDEQMWNIAMHMGGPQRDKTLVYNGHAALDFIYKCHLSISGGITLRAREDKVRVVGDVRPKIVRMQKAPICWFSHRQVPQIIPTARYGLRRSPRSPTLTSSEQMELLSLPIVIINAITKMLRNVRP